ncbi:hypothetical protein SVAN01_06450 [Stagonosporopsis vannaccii]|nr:hypothetical protein SVAN01_06450 [Stagonosporopsis vannaccii]
MVVEWSRSWWRTRLVPNAAGPDRSSRTHQPSKVSVERSTQLIRVLCALSSSALSYKLSAVAVCRTPCFLHRPVCRA